MPPPAQSSGAVTSAQHTVSTEPPASTQVFNNPELLQIILQQVPVEHLTALRPVARAWNDIILKINHIAFTANGHGDENCKCLRTQACVHIPHYTHRFAIRGNPIFTSTHIYRTTTKDRNGEEVTPTTQRHYRGLKLKSWNWTLARTNSSLIRLSQWSRLGIRGMDTRVCKLCRRCRRVSGWVTYGMFSPSCTMGMVVVIGLDGEGLALGMRVPLILLGALMVSVSVRMSMRMGMLSIAS